MTPAPAQESYVDRARKVFDQLCALNPIANQKPRDGAALLEQVTAIFRDAGPTLLEAFRNEARAALERALRDLGASPDNSIASQAPQRLSWEAGMMAFITTYLFWIWENRVTFSDAELLVRAVAEGTLGYRLVDLYLDDRAVGPESVVLGYHLVRSYEDRLAGIFGNELARPILAKYAAMYAEIEFREKANRWKPCPVDWNEVEKLGWKGAPLCAVVHLIMLRAGRSEQYIQTAAQGMMCFLVANQLVDDWRDAVEDLTNGTETLAASGFYAWNQGHRVTEERVTQFLDQARVRDFVKRVLAVLDSASKASERIDDPILSFRVERIKNGLLKGASWQAADEEENGEREPDR